jgi:hypothetical protein
MLHLSRDTLLQQAEQLLDQVYPPDAKGDAALLRQSYQAKLADFRMHLDALSKADKGALKQLGKTLRKLCDRQKTTARSSFRSSLTSWFSLKESKTAEDVKKSKPSSPSVSSALSTDTSTLGMAIATTRLSFSIPPDALLPHQPRTSSPAPDLMVPPGPQEKKQAGSPARHAQFFPPKSEQKSPEPASTSLTVGVLLEQAQDLLNTACPPSDPARAELRRDFLKQLAEYKQASPAKPPTPLQQRALQGMMQTLHEIQASASPTVVATTLHR